MAQVLVAPVLADALNGVPGRRQELERILNTRLRDGSIRTVVVWTAEGEIVLSSNSELEGERVAPSDELLAAIGGTTVADVDAAAGDRLPERVDRPPGRGLRPAHRPW